MHIHISENMDFVNLLASLYAVAYYALADGNQNYSFVAYATTMSIDYNASILAAHRNIKDVLLNRECPQKLEPLNELTHSNALWPLTEEFDILGIIILNNEFWLFVVSYSLNFIVIIL